VAGAPHQPQPETELKGFFDVSIDPLSIIGFDGEYKRVNAAFVRLLGYPTPELFPRSALEILHPDDVAPARAALAQLAEGHDLGGFEARVICADGSVRWLEHAQQGTPSCASSPTPSCRPPSPRAACGPASTRSSSGSTFSSTSTFRPTGSRVRSKRAPT
jgi:PAS domain S-box-containing protein